jgi:hypothetical protein
MTFDDSLCTNGVTDRQEIGILYHSKTNSVLLAKVLVAVCVHMFTVDICKHNAGVP